GFVSVTGAGAVAARPDGGATVPEHPKHPKIKNFPFESPLF
ncbi:hypothetical protein A2U01_0037922, partial [Trifolium medium]|nr:hypothetical protein [Trifolium medium]